MTCMRYRGRLKKKNRKLIITLRFLINNNSFVENRFVSRDLLKRVLIYRNTEIRHITMILNNGHTDRHNSARSVCVCVCTQTR